MSRSAARVALGFWRCSTAAFAAVTLVSAGPRAAAQTAIDVTGEVACEECRITMDTVLTLGGMAGPASQVLQSPVPLAAVDPRGRILLTAWGGTDIALFDSTGKFLGEMGGRGEGPGEYALITHLNVGPTFVHVFDLRGRTVLDSAHNVVRVDRFRADIKWTAVTESETVIFAGDVPTPASVSHKLHLLANDGGGLRSYGSDGSVYRGPSRREFAVAANDSVAWIVEGSSGRVEEWAIFPEPRLSRVINRSIQEFDRENIPNRWPNVANIGAISDARGLWILWWGPDRNWTARTSDPDLVSRWDALGQEIYDGVLDLVDPQTGRTLARYRSDLPMPGFVYGSDMVIAYEETQAGVPYVHFLRPTVHGVVSQTR